VYSLYIGGRLVVVLCGFKTIRDALVKMGDVFSDRPPDMFVMDRVAKKRGEKEVMKVIFVIQKKRLKSFKLLHCIKFEYSIQFN
jgi:hypothetical protein